MKRKYVIPVFTGLIIALSLNAVSAQTFLLQNIPADKIEFKLRFMHPNFKADIVENSTFSGLYDLQVNWKLTPSLRIVGSLPLVSSAVTNFGFFGNDKETELEIGNVFVGIQNNKALSSSRYFSSTFGVYLPIVSESTGFTGIFANFYESQKTIRDMLTLYSNFAYQTITPEGAFYGFEIGPQILVPVGDNNADTELFGHYGLSFGYAFSKATICTELVSLFIISEGDIDLSDRFVNSLNIGAQFTRYRIQPGIFLQFPLSENISDVQDYVLGVQFGYSIK